MVAKHISANFSGDNHLKHACIAQEGIHSLERDGADAESLRAK